MIELPTREKPDPLSVACPVDSCRRPVGKPCRIGVDPWTNTGRAPHDARIARADRESLEAWIAESRELTEPTL